MFKVLKELRVDRERKVSAFKAHKELRVSRALKVFLFKVLLVMFKVPKELRV
jgi:hypothetical protein